MDKIVQEKSPHEAQHVAAMIELKSDDVVIDVGSGIGHVARGLAPHAGAYVCADISEAVIEQCRKFTAGRPNVSCEILKRPTIVPLVRYAPTKIFSNNVFIHMAIFEMVHYLRQVSEMLPRGCIFYCNFNDADYLGGAHDEAFEDMLHR